MKAQMRGANSSGAKFAVIVGEDELARGVGMVKDLTGEADQEPADLNQLPALLGPRLRA
jgi:histidyl-tRNA synthetase